MTGTPLPNHRAGLSLSLPVQNPNALLDSLQPTRRESPRRSCLLACTSQVGVPAAAARHSRNRSDSIACSQPGRAPCRDVKVATASRGCLFEGSGYSEDEEDGDTEEDEDDDDDDDDDDLTQSNASDIQSLTESLTQEGQDGASSYNDRVPSSPVQRYRKVTIRRRDGRTPGQ